MGETNQSRILVVEDEPLVAEVVRRYLERDGHEVRIATDGETALEVLGDAIPDLIVLDLMLPGRDGYDVCQRVRLESDVPLIMLTARTAEADRVYGLDLGADDYVTKPFSPRELAARVRTVLRRAGQSGGPPRLQVGPLILDLGTRELWIRGRELVLTALEYELLACFAQQPRRVFSRSELLDAVWGHDYGGDEATVTVHVRRLREKIEVDPSRPRHLKTVWGVGYRLEP